MQQWACPWKRMLGFHAFHTGITRQSMYAPLATGIATHQCLENVLTAGSDRLVGAPHSVAKLYVSSLIAPVLADYRKQAEAMPFDAGDLIDRELGVVEAMAHGYARIVSPWLFTNFDVVSIEEEIELPLPNGHIWMLRPDFVTRNKQNGALAVHDFKTASAWYDDDTQQWADNVQMMVNARGVQEKYKEPVSHYYMHILIKGNKRSPSILTNPWYRAVPEDISPTYVRSPQYQRTFLPAIGKSIADWVWDMPDDLCAGQFPIIGPFEVQPFKVNQFLRSIPGNEEEWAKKLAAVSDWENWEQPDFQRHLDELFPRTYNCYEFGGRQCPYYDICHKQAGWKTPLQSGKYARRVPHHTTEVVIPPPTEA